MIDRRVLLSSLALLPALQPRAAFAQQTRRSSNVAFSFAVYGDSRSMMYLPYKSSQREEAIKLMVDIFALVLRSGTATPSWCQSPMACSACAAPVDLALLCYSTSPAGVASISPQHRRPSRAPLAFRAETVPALCWGTGNGRDLL